MSAGTEPAQSGSNDDKTWRCRRPLHASPPEQSTLTRTQDKVIIITQKTLTLNGGGSYLKLSQKGFEHGINGDLITKATGYQVPMTVASMQSEKLVFDKTNFVLLPPVTEATMPLCGLPE